MKYLECLQKHNVYITIKYFLISRWAPMNEHSKFVTFTYMGGNVGTLLSYPIYGLILDQLGWEV